jgi:hypothetical protein
MHWLFRPSILAVVSAGLALCASVLVLWPRASDSRAIPLPLAEGDQEIVWLYAATNAAPWERFVTSVGTAVRRLQAEHEELAISVDTRNAFPRQTTGISELALSMKGRKGRLWFRWYKLTSDLKTQNWLKALLQRRPAPLAILGGSSSDLAIELAHSLAEEVGRNSHGAAPLLLLTTATANDEPPAAAVTEETPPVGPLNAIYAKRTFRFCFTNRQMADAVTDFIWSQDSLRPDSDPLYLTFWEDDPYSQDLNQRFCDALHLAATRSTARNAARYCTWMAGFAATGGLPLDVAHVFRGHFRMATPLSQRILYSVGTFDRPNQWESEAARDLILAKHREYPRQERPLLIVPAAAQPARRFLRAMVRIDPAEGRRFVVATGDAIAFNVVYRDRNVTWPIQDLPFPLVFFCHRDPVDPEAGFVESPSAEDDLQGGSSASAGTEDLLLFADIVETLVQASYQDGDLLDHADALRDKLRRARWHKERRRIDFGEAGQPLFDVDGNRHSGTGEHVVHLQPAFDGSEVLPKAKIAVWSWRPDQAPGRRWLQRKTLDVGYEGSSDLDGDAHER